MDLYNTETITRWFPISGYLQVANYVDTYLAVKDEAGGWVKNQTVQLSARRDDGNPTYSTQTANVKTNIWGRIANNPVLPATGGVTARTTFAAGCSGTLTTSNNYGPPGSPTDHWKGSAQVGTMTASITGAAPISPNYSTFAIKFTRICTETYLGLY